MRRIFSKTLALLRERFFAEKPLGRRGEEAAARFLRRRGYQIIARGAHNFLGELDLVALDGETIVFVEVKTRQFVGGDSPADAVDQHKQRRLARLAMTFLKQHGLLEQHARFDVIAVTWPKDQRRPTIDHIEDAFEVASEY